jgi:hypothetical protein
MSSREAIALSQGTWSGASTTGQNQQAAQTLYGMQGNGARWRKNRRGGRRGMGNGMMMHGDPTHFVSGNVSRKNRKNRKTSRKNRKTNRKGTRRNRH